MSLLRQSTLKLKPAKQFIIPVRNHEHVLYTAPQFRWPLWQKMCVGVGMFCVVYSYPVWCIANFPKMNKAE